MWGGADHINNWVSGYFKDHLKENFNVNAPLQLKKDLIRTAYLTGFKDDVRRYVEKF